MPEMEPQDPAPEPQPPMPEMEPQDPAREPEPQPPMGTRLEIIPYRIRFGGLIYTRRGQKRAIAETSNSSDAL